MRVAVDIYHPAHVHMFKHIIHQLKEEGCDVLVLAIQKDVTLKLLNAYEISYTLISSTSGQTLLQKMVTTIGTFLRTFTAFMKFKPDVCIGKPIPMSCFCSFLLRKPHLVHSDDDEEGLKFINIICANIFNATLITPVNFRYHLGKNHLMINSYKELFYLHPSVYTPDPNTIERFKLPIDGYIVVRFVAWAAFHDVKQHGIRNKLELIEELSKRKRVIIVSEGELDGKLKHYQMSAPPEKFHDILAHATLLVADSQTVSAEAAMLGVPVIRCNTWVGENDAAGLKELDEKYGLIYNLSDESEIISVVDKLLAIPNLKEVWREKRDAMLVEKVNLTEYVMEYIHNAMPLRQD